MTTMSYRDAIRAAMREAMRKDPRVFLMGEDVGGYGGAFKVSYGLLAEFGPERVRDTPLSENTFLGAGIGAALGGMRPIVEIMTVNFSLLALDQIVNNAATLRHMSGGQLSVPLVVRMTTGGGRQLAAQHSHSLEGWFAHIPGIKIVAPAVASDARGFVLAALRDPDPVFIFEHATLYPVEGEVDEQAGPAEIGRALVRRPGDAVSLITYGGTLGTALRAADACPEVEVILLVRGGGSLDAGEFCFPGRVRLGLRGRGEGPAEQALGQGLAVFGAEEPGDFVPPLFQFGGDPAQEFSPGFGGELPPTRKCGVSIGEDLGQPGAVDGEYSGEGLAGGRINDIPSRFEDHEFAVEIERIGLHGSAVICLKL